ncbi:MAG: hypothetical protein IPI66_13115 [Chitinophagaceae bacterium]|nr:hypothetical protein [Chitinophagaceae bacterium]MBL0056878.1 hypothetical protein [Chitinophagaceae bacterium]
MPRSKQRKHHHEQHKHPSTPAKAGKSRNAVMVGVIFFALLGMGIGFFATGGSILWILLGALAGGVGGYFFGKQIDKSLADK